EVEPQVGIDIDLGLGFAGAANIALVYTLGIDRQLMARPIGGKRPLQACLPEGTACRDGAGLGLFVVDALRKRRLQDEGAEADTDRVIGIAEIAAHIVEVGLALVQPLGATF